MFFPQMPVGGARNNVGEAVSEHLLTSHQSLIDSIKGYTPNLYYPALKLSTQTQVSEYPDIHVATDAVYVITNNDKQNSQASVASTMSTTFIDVFERLFDDDDVWSSRFSDKDVVHPALTFITCHSDTKHPRRIQ